MMEASCAVDSVKRAAEYQFYIDHYKCGKPRKKRVKKNTSKHLSIIFLYTAQRKLLFLVRLNAVRW